MIPKIIHYIWFGGKPYSDKIKRCIDSWHKFLPEYKFMLWNEDTFDIQNSCIFVQQAFENKNGRLYQIMSDCGRSANTAAYILIPTLKSQKPLGHLLDERIVLGTDELGHLTALMASEPCHPFWDKILQKVSYNDIHPAWWYFQYGGQQLVSGKRACRIRLQDFESKAGNKRWNCDISWWLVPCGRSHVGNLAYYRKHTCYSLAHLDMVWHQHISIDLYESRFLEVLSGRSGQAICSTNFTITWKNENSFCKPPFILDAGQKLSRPDIQELCRS